MPTKAELEQQIRDLQAQLAAQANWSRSRSLSEPLFPYQQQRHVSPLAPALKDQKLDQPPEFDGKVADYATFIVIVSSSSIINPPRTSTTTRTRSVLSFPAFVV